MKWREWLDKWDMTSLKFNVKFLEMEWTPNEPDRDAAWDLYVELLTRITTQTLRYEQGDEKKALESVYTLFPLTRDTLRRHGRKSGEFAKIAVVMLNQVLRPFTTKWHKELLSGAFAEPAKRAAFRAELDVLSRSIRRYSQMLAEMAGVEDLSELSE